MPEAARNPYPRLFSPIELSGHRLRNRIVHVSFSTGMAAGGDVSERMINYTANRARGGAAMLVTEALISDNTDPTLGRVQAFKEERLDSLKRWAEAVERHDCRMVGQIFNLGRASLWGPHRGAIGPSANTDYLSRTVPHVLSREAIHDLVDQHAGTAERLKRAGFSGVEISSAHAFLYLQFLSPWANRRDDAYGGDVVGRTRFAREVLAEIRARCGADFIVGYKMPATDGIEGSIDPEEAGRIVRELARTGCLSYFCFSQGHGPTLPMHAPDMNLPRGPYLHHNRTLRAAAGDVPIIAVGRIVTPAQAEGVLEDGLGDLIGLGRPLLADPAWPRKAQAGASDDIRPCISCNQCWNDLLRGYGLNCFHSPRVGTADEVDWQPEPAARRKRVVVVGAGVAGLEAATLAARRGHDVRLYSASTEIGGKARLHARLPGGEEVARVYAQQGRAAEQAGVKIIAGQAADLDAIVAEKPDAVIMASGSTMVPPEGMTSDLPMQDLRAVAAAHLADSDRGGGTAVVYDIDQTAATYAAIELLAGRYRRVVVLTALDSVARDEAWLYQQGVLSRLYAREVEIIPHVRPVSLRNGRLDYANVYTGKISTLAGVELFTYATPRRQNDDAVAPLRQAGIEVITAGDCHQPQSMLTAMHGGFRAGLAV